MDLFLMSSPGPRWQLRGRVNFRSGDAEQVDAAAAIAEWTALVEAIEAAGGRVVRLPFDDELTGLPYCAEAGHPLPAKPGGRPRFLLPRMWAEHRRDECALWRPFVSELGFEPVELARGYWEAQGDVAQFRGRNLLFFGGRTDADGVAAARPYFADDAIVIEVRLPAFHGNVAALAIDAIDRLVVCPQLLAGDGMDRLSRAFGRDALIEISPSEARAYATNALPVGTTLIAPTIAPARVLRLLEDAGMTIVSLSMRELCEKAGGASRCLVCEVPEAIAAQLDREALDRHSKGPGR